MKELALRMEMRERVLRYFASAGVGILDLYGRMPSWGKLHAGEKLEWGKVGK